MDNSLFHVLTDIPALLARINVPEPLFRRTRDRESSSEEDSDENRADGVNGNGDSPCPAAAALKKKFKTIMSKEVMMRLNKKLLYILRYGALNEGLTVHKGGYVVLDDLLKVSQLRHNTATQVLELVSDAVSFRGTPRFEKKSLGGAVYVRARSGVNMDRDSHHQGSSVKRLVGICTDKICANIKDYNLQNFPDVYLLNSIIYKLKRKKQLSNNVLRQILSTNTEHLDLERVYITPATLRLVADRCPNLSVLSLRGTSYLLTDHYMEHLFRKLKNLRSLNLSGCHHLTDRTLKSLTTNILGLIHLDASGNYNYTEKALLDVVLSCAKLQHLDIYDNPNITDTFRNTLVEISHERKLTIVLKGLNDKSVAPEDPSTILSVWRSTMA